MGKALAYERVIIFGGQISEISTEVLNLITKNDFIICADKGYEFALKNKITPNIIVGDFDSAPYPDNVNCEIVKLPTVKDDTDLNYAVKLAKDKGFKSFVLTGVTGGRLDQTYATIFTMNFILKSGAQVTVIDNNVKLYITNDNLTIPMPRYDCHLSVFPIGEMAEGVDISGAKYTLNNATLTNDFPLGVSNEFSDNAVTVNVKSGTLLIMVVKK